MANVGFGLPMLFSRRTERGCHGEAEALLGAAEVPGRVGVTSWIESFWGRFKTENASVFWEAETLEEVVEIVDSQMVYYNRERRHSALHYQPPEGFLGRLLNERIPSVTILADISP